MGSGEWGLGGEVIKHAAPVEQTRGRVCVLNGNRESGIGNRVDAEIGRPLPSPDSRLPMSDSPCFFSHAAIFIPVLGTVVVDAMNIPPPPGTLPNCAVNELLIRPVWPPRLPVMM